MASGVAKVLRFNWPRYAAGLATAALGATVPLPGPLRPAARAAGALAATWTATSVLATWWAYDRSPLYRWRWLLPLLPEPPARYAVLSMGLDEISATLGELFPAAGATLLDLHDPGTTPEGSIRRARACHPPPEGSRPARPEHLPVPDAALDAVFAVLAAHELRTHGQRLALYREIARTLRPGGRLILVEHCRDAANMLAYGPGAWHFHPRAEWLRLGRHAGLVPAGEQTMTPLVRALAYRR
jgi:SAM-dependent methyltransferase